MSKLVKGELEKEETREIYMKLTGSIFTVALSISGIRSCGLGQSRDAA